MTGKVYIVGAGPGDPDLITVRGLNHIKTADLVAYDRLVSLTLLENTRPDAELVYVGKTPYGSATSQSEIGRILVAAALAGKKVVRLKGGDPFVFGRGGEEAQLLARHAIPFEIVPGISSAISVPAYAGIPVTQRQISTSFTVVTGHTLKSDVDWDSIPQKGTLVILMGVKNLRLIAKTLMARGRAPDTPTAVIENGSTQYQRTLTSPLEKIADQAEEAEIAPPAIVVVGEVVTLREEIAWFDNFTRELV